MGLGLACGVLVILVKVSDFYESESGHRKVITLNHLGLILDSNLLTLNHLGLILDDLLTLNHLGLV
jgi:hypothetical protein